MRRIAILLTAALALLLANALGFQADATMGSGTQGLPMAAKDYSPIDRVSCSVPVRLYQGVPPVEVLVRPLPLAA